MNLWIFNHYAITPNFPGGTRHFDFSKQLIKKGYKVTIFASSFHYMLLQETKEYDKKFFLEEDYEGVKFVWIKTPPYKKSDWRRVVNMLVYTLRAFVAGIILGKKEKPDVIIGSSVHLFAPLAAYFLSKIYKTPFILEIRDIWPQALIDLGINKYHPFVILLSWIEKFLYKKAHKIISLLDKFYDYIKNLKNLKINPEKIVVIPNGVSLERIEKNLVNGENNSYSDEGIIKIAYTGALGKGNDSDFILKLSRVIFKEKKVKLYIIGGGYNKDKIIKKLQNFEDFIVFEKPLSKDQIYEKLFSVNILLFRVADIGQYGLSSNKLFDYLVVGKPIIFWANIPYNIVEEIGAGITVKEDDPIKVIEAIQKIMSMSEEERKLMGQRAREYVIKNHSVEILSNKLDQVIKEVYNDFLKNK